MNLKSIIKWKKPDTQILNTVWFHFYELLQKAKINRQFSDCHMKVSAVKGKVEDLWVMEVLSVIKPYTFHHTS